MIHSLERQPQNPIVHKSVDMDKEWKNQRKRENSVVQDFCNQEQRSNSPLAFEKE